MKKTLLALAVAGAAVSAQADTTLSGHVNYKIGDLEDWSANEDITIGAANTSKSRFRIKSSFEANGTTWGIYEELGVNTGGTLDVRFNEFFAKGGFGKVTLGQGSAAGDGGSENDFSGTYLTFGDMSSYEIGGEFAAVNSRDIGRQERIRYDTPKLGPVSLAISYNDADDVNVAADVGGSNWKASVAVVSAEADDSDVVQGSIAGKISGFTAAVQFYSTETQNDFEQTRVVVGYNPGPISISVDLQTSENDDKSIDAETTGLNFVYRPTKGVELYAGVRNVENNVTSNDGDGVILGGRVKF